MKGIFQDVKMRKRYYSVIIAFILLSVFSGCKEQVRHYKIGVSQCSEDLWRETVNSEIMREARLYDNIDVEIRSVRDDSEKQIKDIEYFVSKAKVDILVVSPNESAELTPVLTKVFQDGTPVILLDRKIDNDQYTASVGADNQQIGYMAGEYINAMLKGCGNVFLVRGTKGSTADTERYEGYIDATFIYPTGGDAVIELAQKILTGAPFEKENILQSSVVDASNLRLFDLQDMRITEQQKKVEDLNSKVSIGLLKYTRAKYLLFITVFFIILFVAFVILLYKSNRNKNKLNELLVEQNSRIQKHMENLQLQKNQLMELSKKTGGNHSG